jgi:hypothetical protein
MNDLPGSAVQLIQKLAAERRVPGTIKQARVCRAWHAASSGWDWEPLRLALNLDVLDEQQLQTAVAWLTKHGRLVQRLDIKVYVRCNTPAMQQLWAVFTNYQNLTCLEVEGEEVITLVDVAPLLPQVPRLQHLKASMSLMEECVDGPGLFSTGDGMEALQSVPVLEELCPQLLGLHLVIYSASNHMDPRLSQLLPHRLQQLQLEVVGVPHVVDPPALIGCTALQQLTLQGVQVDDGQALAAVNSLATVRMVDVIVHDVELLSLSSKLVQYTTRTYLYWEDPQVPGQLTALTALTIRHGISPYGQYTLTSLTALHHLELLGMKGAHDSQLPLLLRQLAGLPQLRDLCLSGKCPRQHVSGVSALRQLTGLAISGLSHADVGVAVELEQQDGPWPGLLQQLPGLQRVEVDQELVTVCHQPWWTKLTALTQLVVVAPSKVPVLQIEAALAAGTVPATLQQLVVKVVLSDDWEEEEEGPKWCVRGRSTLPGVTLVTWQLLDYMLTYELPAAVTPCPWLPGVWEVPQGS